MLTLIRREIEDNLAFLIGAGLFSAIIVFIIISLGYSLEDMEIPIHALFFVSMLFVVLGFSAMGANQMRVDTRRKISAFLVTLPAGRVQIFTARIVTGLIAILILLVPAAVTISYFLTQEMPFYPLLSGVLFRVFSVIFLGAFACYCLGLQAGQFSSKVVVYCTTMLIPVTIILLVIIKGFYYQGIIILVLLIVASLARSLQKFINSAL